MSKVKNRNFKIFALAAHGVGLSGGDRIYIELARRWAQKVPIHIYVWEEGHQMLKRQHLEFTDSNLQIPNREKNEGVYVHISRLGKFCRFSFLICYIARIIEGIRLGLTMRLENNSKTHIYSASEFWMDSLPCVLLKIRFPKITWVASWYQTAPNPIKGFEEPLNARASKGKQRTKGKGQREHTYKISALLYWIIQFPIKPLIKKFADKIIVNNEDEKKQFPDHTKRENTIVLIGAVPLEEIKEYLNSNHQMLNTKKYDAVFQGRFHPQKGVVELIDIWEKVVKKIPNAKLAMIGDGPLMKDVRSRILDLRLENNVKLFGYVFDGPDKYKIFAQSKIVVHPAFYDSGGMATTEAMAFGLPAVGFDLRAYDSYFPKGMVKSKGEDKFAMNIIRLLRNKNEREKLGREVKRIIEQNYSWDKRAQEIYMKITGELFQ